MRPHPARSERLDPTSLGLISFVCLIRVRFITWTSGLPSCAREELAALWLPWCVDRSRPTEILRIRDDPDRVEEALQLQVADLADANTRAALARQPHDGGGTSLRFIEELAKTYSSAARCGQILLPQAKALTLSEGVMLRDGSHRTVMAATLNAAIKRFNE
jgi:hypothetical protein